jgi:signal peptidase I
MEGYNEYKIKNALKIIENIFLYIILTITIILIIFTSSSRFKGQQPSIFGYKIYEVQSGSMTPTINMGSLIIVKEINPKDIKTNDIITYKGSTQSLVTHRVVDIQKKKEFNFVTKGDANTTPDPLVVRGEDVFGKVIFSIPIIGYILNFLKTNIYFIISIILLIILTFIYIKKQVNKKSL